jgi:hypothetical protein
MLLRAENSADSGSPEDELSEVGVNQSTIISHLDSPVVAL